MRKSTLRRIVVGSVVGALCLSTTLGIVAGQDRLSNFYSGLNITNKDEDPDVAEKAKDPYTGETIVHLEDKTDMMLHIYNNKQKFTILEIVPFENAAKWNASIGTEKAREAIEPRLADLFEVFYTNSDATDEGSTTWRKNQVNALKKPTTVDIKPNNNYTSTPFSVTYDPISKSYSLDYRNYFMEVVFAPFQDLNKIKYDKLLNYFEQNTEIITVPAGQLTYDKIYREDPVDLIYMSANSQNVADIKRTIFINDPTATAAFLHGNNSEVSKYHSGVYKFDGTNYTEYSISDATSVGYDTYSMNKYGEYVPNDINWDMAKLLISYVFDGTGNSNTNGGRVPVIFDQGTMGPDDTNMVKLYRFFYNATNCEGSVNKYGDSTYYKDILATVSSRASGDETGFQTKNAGSGSVEVLDGKIIKFSETVKVTIEGNVASVESSSEEQDNLKANDSISKAGGYLRLAEVSGKKYIYLYNSKGERINTAQVSGSSASVKFLNPMEYRITNDDFYYNSNKVTTATLDAPWKSHEYGSMYAENECARFNNSEITNIVVANNPTNYGGASKTAADDRGLTEDDGTVRPLGIIRYFMGLDDTDFLVPPDAMFESTADNEVFVTSDENVFVVYNPALNEDGTYTLKYKAYDENLKIYEAKLYYIEDGTEKVLKSYSFDPNVTPTETIEEEFTTDAALAEKIFQCKVKIYFEVTNELNGRRGTKVYLKDKATLCFANRQMYDLD